MLDRINQIKKESLKEIEEIKSLDRLQNFEVKYLGRKSELNEILRSLSGLSSEEKRRIGPEANSLKKELEDAAAAKRKTLSKTAVDFDLSLPGIAPKVGHKHPLTKFLEKVEGVFDSMGFEVVDGPEIESDEYNFDLLNIPKEHPARDMWDTYYIKNPKSQTLNSKLLLRTHTSPVQLRAMETRKPPVRIIVPGRVFRHEATDAGHEKNFYQCEGFVIDKNVSLANLVSTLRVFVKRIFGEKIEIRVRPSYFPFVEPGIEVDMSCLICNGKAPPPIPSRDSRGLQQQKAKPPYGSDFSKKVSLSKELAGGRGCPACKKSGWVEVLGAGMIHPKVLENMARLRLASVSNFGEASARQAKVGKFKWNPKEYSGFAFGLGIDRFAMLYYGINDIRLFYSGDLRFVKQF